MCRVISSDHHVSLLCYGATPQHSLPAMCRLAAVCSSLLLYYLTLPAWGTLNSLGDGEWPRHIRLAVWPTLAMCLETMNGGRRSFDFIKALQP